MATVAQKKLDKKVRLLQSAYALFESKGVSMTAVDDVVKAADAAAVKMTALFEKMIEAL